MSRVVVVLISLITSGFFFLPTSAAFAATCPEVVSLNKDALKCTSESENIVEDVEQFVTLDMPDDTLFGRRWYGRLADNANVYAEPSRSAPIVRNVGDGYLFATINSWADNEAGETWYNINYGEYVHSDDIKLATPSDFRGVAINSQPQRPFGWVVVRDVFPSTEPDGEPDESLEKLARYTFVEIHDVVMGEEDWLWYDVGNGRWLKQTNFSIVDVDLRPAEVGEDEYWVEVDLYEQTFLCCL